MNKRQQQVEDDQSHQQQIVQQENFCKQTQITSNQVTLPCLSCLSIHTTTTPKPAAVSGSAIISGPAVSAAI